MEPLFGKPTNTNSADLLSIVQTAFDPPPGLDNMRDPGILDPRHFFFPRHFYTIYAIFTRFYAIFTQFYIIFTEFHAKLRDSCDFYAIFCQAQNV